MKKVFFAALALVAMLSVASCKSDKCICTYETKIIKEQETEPFTRPDDKKCSELKSSDLDIAGVKIDLSVVVDVKCKNYHE